VHIARDPRNGSLTGLLAERERPGLKRGGNIPPAVSMHARRGRGHLPAAPTAGDVRRDRARHVEIVFGRSADLGNPARVGRYTSEETVGNLRSRGEARRSKTAGGAAAIELFTSTAPRP
jgi:hypothetical protein